MHHHPHYHYAQPPPCSTSLQYFSNYQFKHLPVVRAVNPATSSVYCLWDDEVRPALPRRPRHAHACCRGWTAHMHIPDGSRGSCLPIRALPYPGRTAPRMRAPPGPGFPARRRRC